MLFLLFTDVVLKKWSNELREKIIALLLTAVLMITACGAKETMQDAADTSSSVIEAATEESTKDSAEDEFVQKVIEAAGATADMVGESLADDFDGDGTKEAFVFICKGEDKELNSFDGEVWFASDKACKQIEEEFSFYARDNKVINVLSVEGKNFILVDKAFMSSSSTSVFYVEGGECKESVISGIGGFYKSEDTGDYCVNLDMYDASLEFDSAEDANDPNLLLEYGPGLEKGLYSGHTWKEYFLYYDKDKADFVEYATKELTEEKLADACGFDLAGEIKAEGFTLGHIYRRDNGIININYCMRTDNANGSVLIEYKNATYNEKTKSFMYDGGEGEKPWQKSDCGGIFLANI